MQKAGKPGRSVRSRWYFLFEQRGGGADRIEDLDVARAHAEVPGQAPADLLFGRIEGARQQRMGREHHAGGAVAALEAVLGDERLLNRMERPVLRQSLDRQDLAAIRLHSEDQARLHQQSIEKDGAGAALADDAADVSSGQSEVLAEKLEE